MIASWSVLILLAGLHAEPDEHWAFQPRQKPLAPAFTDAAAKAWIRTPIDAFLLDKLRKEGFQPAPEADRSILVRRLYFDLTGLPPTPEEVTAFLHSKDPDAYEKLVDRLLASPRYGEKWGRHWLDVVRYSESEGFEYDRLRPGAWRYRDYVIDALKEDKPFDRFVLEQVAGDEVDPKDHACLAAAGFHRLGPVRRNAGNKDIAMSRNEVLTEMTDAIGAAFLGLTVGCARCHDHRFDPISIKDYYQLQAFLGATQEHDLVLATDEEQKAWKVKSDKVEEEIKVLFKKLNASQLTTANPLLDKLEALKRSRPEPLPTISSVRHRTTDRTNVRVLKRGDPERPGAAVGPRVLQALAPEAKELPGDIDAPRTRLARWIADPANPLPTRVWVNRVWQYHFGKGLVETANDFGANGTPPSHPELLDFLANWFLEAGQRTKPLHRLILLSSAYRQSSTPGPKHKDDPNNRWLSHFSRRRLAGEEVRDSMLSVADVLNNRLGGPSVLLPVDDDLVQQLYDPSQWRVTDDVKEHQRRSIYLLAKRNLQLPFFQVFDQPDAQTSCSRRESSTHPLQALELLNGATANRLAGAFAERLKREAGLDRNKQVERAFWLIAGRAPTAREQEVAESFLARQSLKEFALASFNINAFLYVD